MVDESAEQKQQAVTEDAVAEITSDQASEAEQTEQPDVMQHADTPPQPRKADLIARTFAVIALVCTLAVLAAGVMLWQQLENYNQNEELVTLQSEITRLKQQFSQQIERLSVQQRKQLAAFDQDKQILQAGIGRVTELVSRNQNDWSLAETEYLLSMANQRVQLHADPVTAMQALSLADEVIEKLADPAWFPVREKIAVELAALRSVPQLDTAGISAQLVGIAAQVPNLPVVKIVRDTPDSTNELQSGQQADAVQPAQASSDSLQDWQTKLSQMLKDIWAELKGLVKIRQTDEEVKPLLSPASHQFLIQNVQLQLQSARVALLQRDRVTYMSALQTANEWIGTYFQSKDEAVSALRKEIDALATRDIAPALPDISGSLNTLRRLQATGPAQE